MFNGAHICFFPMFRLYNAIICLRIHTFIIICSMFMPWIIVLVWLFVTVNALLLLILVDFFFSFFFNFIGFDFSERYGFMVGRISVWVILKVNNGRFWSTLNFRLGWNMKFFRMLFFLSSWTTIACLCVSRYLVCGLCEGTALKAVRKNVCYDSTLNSSVLTDSWCEWNREIEWTRAPYAQHIHGINLSENVCVCAHYHRCVCRWLTLQKRREKKCVAWSLNERPWFIMSITKMQFHCSFCCCCWCDVIVVLLLWWLIIEWNGINQ